MISLRHQHSTMPAAAGWRCTEGTASAIWNRAFSRPHHWRKQVKGEEGTIPKAACTVSRMQASTRILAVGVAAAKKAVEAADAEEDDDNAARAPLTRQ